MKNYFFILFLFLIFLKINAQKDSLQKKIDSLEIKLLKEVTVENKKKLFERKVDRLVFNVENSIQATGGDVIDALKVTPGIRVENDKISMIGKSGMSVMIDDRMIQISGEDLINYLRSIPSDNIKSIEVITTPPAKYEAQGNSGIINIQLKKAKKDSWNASLKSSYTQATYPSGNIGGTFSYQKNKLTLGSNINYTNGNFIPYQEYTLYYPNYTWFEIHKSRNFQNYLSGRIIFDYKINSKINMGIEYFNISNNPIIKSVNNSQIINTSNNSLDSLVHTSSYTEITKKNNTINFYIINKLDTLGKKITFNLDYLHYNSNINNQFTSNTYFPNEIIIPNNFLTSINNGIQKIKIYSGDINLELPLKWIKLNFGTKLSFIKTDNLIYYFNEKNKNLILDENKSNQFLYYENTQAIYLSINKELTKKLEFQLGFRLENTQTNGNSKTLNQENQNNYLKLFPTLYLNYKINENNSYSFNYNRRINRPNYSNLNPFKFYSSRYNYSEGNPFLEPYISDNFEISNTYKKFNSSIYFNYLTNGIDQVTYVSYDNPIQRVIPYNFYNQINTGFVETITFNWTKWWESNNQLNLFYTKTISDFPNTVPNIKSWSSSISSNNIFNLDKLKNIKGEMNLVYNTPSVAGSYNILEYYVINTGVRFLFFSKKMQFNIYITDIFKTNKQIFTQIVNEIRQKNYDYYDTQKIRFSIVYNFGKSFKIPSQTTSNEEEKKRIN